MKHVLYTLLLTLTLICAPQYPTYATPDGMNYAHGTILPGVTLIQDSPDGDETWYCTLGLIVVDKKTHTHHYGITAGHCYHPGIIYALDDAYEPNQKRPVGYWLAHRSPPETDTEGLGFDLGMFTFTKNTPVGTTIGDGSIHYSSILQHASDITRFDSRDKVCKFGSTTGITCGPLSNLSRPVYSEGKVIIPAPHFSAAGDSGGPVWVIDPHYGTVLVGVVNSARDDGSSTTVQCVADYLRDWNMELLT